MRSEKNYASVGAQRRTRAVSQRGTHTTAPMNMGNAAPASLLTKKLETSRTKTSTRPLAEISNSV